jgi:hypothetical protein
MHLAVVVLVDEVLGAEVDEHVLQDEPVDVAHGGQVVLEGARHLDDVQLLAQVVHVEEDATQRMVDRDGGRAHALRPVGVLGLEVVGLFLKVV